MKTDIEIAQEAVMRADHRKLRQLLEFDEDDLELYGKYKAKLSDEFLEKDTRPPRRKTDSGDSNQPDSRRRGQDNHHGRTGRGIWQNGKKAVIALREPSLGPMFWYQRRCSRRRLCPGSSDGGTESSFYR